MSVLATAISATARFADEEPDFDPNSVTPGVIGFVFTFIVMALTVVLVIDMVRRIRRTQYRQMVQEKLAAERAEAAGTADAGTEQATPEQPPAE